MMLEEKEKKPFKKLQERFPDRQWYMLVTADTYVVPENLASLLSDWAIDQPRLLLAKPEDDPAGPVVVNAEMLMEHADLTVAGEWLAAFWESLGGGGFWEVEAGRIVG